MNRVLAAISMLAVVSSTTGATTPPAIPQDPQIEKKIESVLNQMTLEEKVGQMGGNYNYDAVMDVEWEFGDGLNYTEYEYSNLKIDKTTFSPEDKLQITIDVKNIGDVDGKEYVLLFSKDMVTSISPENRKLREFTHVDQKASETKSVSFEIPASALAFVGADNRWRIESGEFLFACGTERITVEGDTTKIWETPNIE